MISEDFSSVRKYIWDYFQLHAQQRLTTFNFYIVLSTLITTGLFSTFQKDFILVPVGVVLGSLLVCLSFIFWKLDERNRALIKHAEGALKILEQKPPLEGTGVESQSLRIFTREDSETERLRANQSGWPWEKLYSYSDCFRFIFLIFGSLGFLGALLSVYRAIW
jgi:hypothetical protein